MGARPARCCSPFREVTHCRANVKCSRHAIRSTAARNSSSARAQRFGEPSGSKQNSLAKRPLRRVCICASRCRHAIQSVLAAPRALAQQLERAHASQQSGRVGSVALGAGAAAAASPGSANALPLACRVWRQRRGFAGIGQAFVADFWPISCIRILKIQYHAEKK